MIMEARKAWRLATASRTRMKISSPAYLATAWLAHYRYLRRRR